MAQGSGAPVDVSAGKGEDKKKKMTKEEKKKEEEMVDSCSHARWSGILRKLIRDPLGAQRVARISRALNMISELTRCE
jgi:hypothetical protein